MTTHLPEEFFTRLIDWHCFVIVGNAMPPLDPEEGDEGEEENDDEAENPDDDPPVVREPDEE